MAESIQTAVDPIDAWPDAQDGERVLPFGPPVGSIPFLPPGARPEITECGACHRPLGITPDSGAAWTRKGYRLLPRCDTGGDDRASAVLRLGDRER
jgi:hypothetical protein